MYSLIGISMVLTAAMLASLGTSLALTAGWRVLLRIAERFGPGSESRFWMAVGMLPALAGACAGFLVAAPAYLKYEPRHTQEHISPLLGLLATVSLLVLATALWRSLRVALRGAELSRALKAHAKRVRLGAGDEEIYELPESSRISTVVGLLRPTMFFSRAVMAVLNAPEMAIVLRHERAHVRARDNGAGLLLDFACRLTGNPVFTRAVRGRWVEAAEIAADHAAVRAPEEAVDLLSALLKVARLQTCPAVAGLGCSFIPSAAKSHLRRRIENLQAIADGKKCEGNGISSLVAVSGFLTFAAALAAIVPEMLGTTHAGLELLMR